MRDDFKEFYRVIVREGLAHSGLTEAEYAIMGWLVLEYSGIPDELARRCLRDEPSADPSPYLYAIKSLISRSFALVLDAKRIRAMRAEVERNDIPVLDWMPENCFQPGDVDLTEAGYRTYRDAHCKIAGHVATELLESGWIDDERETIQVYSLIDSWGMTYRVGEAIRRLSDRGLQVISVHPPVRIGRWRVNRFLTYDVGACVQIDYRPPL